MKRSIHVRLNVEVPTTIPLPEVREWIEFRLGVRCEMKADNRLANADIEATDLYICEDV